MWIIWLIIAAFFAVAEVLTPGFVLLWFAVGAGVASLLAMIGVQSLAVQIVAFLIVSILLVIASRTIFEKILIRQPIGSDLKTGVEVMIGKVGTVVEGSRGSLNEGAVKVYGSVWTAFPIDGEDPLEEGESVSIERVDGNSIFVRRIVPRKMLFSQISKES